MVEYEDEDDSQDEDDIEEEDLLGLEDDSDEQACEL